MNSFEHGFFSELQKLATVEDGTLSFPKRISYSEANPADPKYKTPAQRERALMKEKDRRDQSDNNSRLATRLAAPIAGLASIGALHGATNSAMNLGSADPATAVAAGLTSAGLTFPLAQKASRMTIAAPLNIADSVARGLRTFKANRYLEKKRQEAAAAQAGGR